MNITSARYVRESLDQLVLVDNLAALLLDLLLCLFIVLGIGGLWVLERDLKRERECVSAVSPTNTLPVQLRADGGIAYVDLVSHFEGSEGGESADDGRQGGSGEVK